MKKVYVRIYEDDEQFDVEVYQWNEKENRQGILMREHCEYALASTEEVNDFIESLKRSFDVVKVERNDEKELVSSLPMFTPDYVQFEFDCDEFEEYLNNYLYSVLGVFAKVDIFTDDDEYPLSASIYLNEESVSKSGSEYVYEFYPKDSFEESLLQEIFKANQVLFGWDGDCYIVKIPFVDYMKKV